MKVSYGSLFIYCGSYPTKPVPVTACAWAWAAAPRLVSFRPVGQSETGRGAAAHAQALKETGFVRYEPQYIKSEP